MTASYLRRQNLSYSVSRLSPVDACLLLLALAAAAFVDQYIFTVGGPPPIVFHLIAFACFASTYLVRAALGAPTWAGRSKRFRQVLLILGFFLAWTIFAFSYSSHSEVANQLLIDRFKVAAFIFLFAYLLDHTNTHRPFYTGCLLLACFGALMNVYDFLVPTFSTVPGRAAGLYLNPTTSGFMIICLAVFGLRSVGVAMRYLAWFAISVGVILTFSRAGWLYLIVSTLGLSWLGYFGFGRARYLFAITLMGLLGLLTWALLTGALYEVIASTPFASSLDLNTLARIGSSGSIFDDFAADERSQVAALGVERFWESPLFGNGLAFTHEWEMPISTHNMYVLFLAEGGVFGLLFYASFLGYLILAARDVGLILAAILFLVGFFTHNLFDLPGYALVLAAMMTVGSLRPRHNEADNVNA